MAKLKVNGYSNLVKDTASGCVVNDNHQSYIEYKKKREIALLRLNEKKALENRIIDIETDINKVKSDVNDIKDMLRNIIIALT